MQDILQNPLIQFGFAGLCLILIGIIVWMIKIIVGMFKSNQKIIAENTLAYTKLTECISNIEKRFDDLEECFREYEQRADRIERRHEAAVNYITKGHSL